MRQKRWGSFKVAVSIEGGWGSPCTFEMAGESYIQELNRVAQEVRAKFTIKKLHFGGFWISGLELTDSEMEILRMIAEQIEEQGGEVLSKLEFDMAALMSNMEVGDIVFSLVEASKEWTMHYLTIPLLLDGYSEGWTKLTNSSDKGHIGKLVFYWPPLYESYHLARTKMKHVKAVWEISEEVTISNLVVAYPKIGGGRREDPKITWEEAYKTLLKAFC